MESDEEWHHVDDEKSLNGIKCTRNTPPRLRKNKRLEQRWGQQYYTAVKDAVFAVRINSHTPAEPPLSVREEADDCQPLYVCQQCKDCFRFLSSFQAHNSRRSWILGYWCHSCFFIDCSHVQKGQPPCSECQAINRERTMFLKAKGLRKGRKMGSIKIFYNQCQFFAHLRGHGTTIVDMADVMLMPLPVDIDEESYTQLEHLCEIIMERMFLTRRHIMDWLRFQQLGSKWWNTLQSNLKNNDGPLSELLTGGSRGGKKSPKHSSKPQKINNNSQASPGEASPGPSVTYPSSSDTPSSISETIESVIAQSTREETMPSTNTKDPEMPPLTSITHINPLEPIEDDDNPCTTADIAFVDCGPAARTYPPDVAIVLPSMDKLSIIPNGKASSNSIVTLSVDPHPPMQTSKPIILKRRSGDKDLCDTSRSTSSLTSQSSFEPKISVKKFANERLKTSPVVACEKNYARPNNRVPQTLRKLAPASKVKIPSGKTSIPSVMEIARVVESVKKPGSQASAPALGSKIVTVHSPKSTQISKIISQLPPDVISGKKIVFIGQDAEKLTILPNNNEAVPSSLGMIKIPSETEKLKIVQNHQGKIAPVMALNTAGEQGLRLALETTQNGPSSDKPKPKVQQIFLDGKVIYQNGKKFIIRQARKSIPEPTVCSNINNLKLQTIPKRVSLSSLLSKARLPVTSYIPIAAKPVDVNTNQHVPALTSTPFTSSSPSLSSSPSPSPSLSPSLSISEDSIKDSISWQTKAQVKPIQNESERPEKLASSACDSKSESVTTFYRPSTRERNFHNAEEYFTIQKNPAGKSYVDLSKGKQLSSIQSATNHKQQVYYDYRNFGAERIKQQIEHVTKINAEFLKMLGVSNTRMPDNLKVIKELEDALEEEPLCLDEDREINPVSRHRDINEILTNLTETTETQSTCSTCNRSFTPDSYSFESSRESSKSSTCRSCNNYVCHICDTFQGNLSRFRAHLNYHAKKEPFTCPECFRRFPAFDKLETHTWTTCFHLMSKRWFKCKVCQVEGFLTMESVTKHFILAHSSLKIVCPECGLLSDSRAVFQKHIERKHAKVANQLKPVDLMLCDVGSCVIRLEDYRLHMDHHAAVLNMLYYKCTFCPYMIQAMKRSKEEIRSHLYKKHIDKLYELGFENLHLDNIKLSSTSGADIPHECIPNTHETLTSDSQSEKTDQNKEVVESEQNSSVSPSLDKNASVIALNDTPNNSQTNIQTSDYLDAKLTEQTLKDGVECSIWSINLDKTESSESMNLGSGSLEITTTVQEAGNISNNVINEYSSSPKIFDVRSVTPDSYAELGGATKEQVDVSGISREPISESFLEMNSLESEDHIVVTESGTKDSLVIKMGEQLLPMKLPQVIVIDDAKTDMNLTEILHSSWAGSNTFVKLSDLTKSNAKTVTSNIVELEADLTDEITKIPKTKEPVIKTVFTLARPPAAKKFEKKIGSTTVRKLTVPVSGKKQGRPVSLLRPMNSGIQISQTGVTEPNDRVFDPFRKISDECPTTTNTSAACEEKSRDLSLCEIPKPPPLSRIPQHLLEEVRVEDEVEEEEEEEEIQEVEEITTTPKLTSKLRQRQKRPWRIALNGPICSSELINYRCHLCGELINTSWSVLRNHFSSRHSQDYKLVAVTPRLLPMSSDFISEGYKEVLGCKKRRSDGSMSSSKRRRRWNPKKRVEKHPLDLGLCVRQESVQDGEGKFVCKKCDQQCDDISSLRTHIGTNHRIKDHYLVCLECGENFVVEPSLQMHLKAFHCIQDPCTYLAQNTAYAKKITETMGDESNTGIANQCHVCMAVFEDKLAVDKHLRVHGMAFLNRKRIEAQNAARNPEKKIKIDKPDNGSPDDTQKSEKFENIKLEKMESVDGEVRES